MSPMSTAYFGLFPNQSTSGNSEFFLIFSNSNGLGKYRPLAPRPNLVGKACARTNPWFRGQTLPVLRHGGGKDTTPRKRNSGFNRCVTQDISRCRPSPNLLPSCYKRNDPLWGTFSRALDQSGSVPHTWLPLLLNQNWVSSVPSPVVDSDQSWPNVVFPALSDAIIVCNTTRWFRTLVCPRAWRSHCILWLQFSAKFSPKGTKGWGC